MVGQEFLADRNFRSHWSEFRASAVELPEEGLILTTTDAGEFFNEYSLVDQPLNLEFCRHVPGMLTALGIIGTFAGLITGLAGFERANLEASIYNLLQGVQNAFSCSFLAIFLAVIVTAVERSIVSKLYAQVHVLRENLNRLFSKSQTDDYLNRMVRLMEGQEGSLRSFSQDLSEAIRQAMQELVSQQTTSMASANAMIAQQVAQAMKDVMEPAVARLTGAVEEVQRQSASSSQDALRDLVSQFSETLAATTGRQMDGLMAAIAGSTETMGTMRAELGAIATAMRDQMEAQQAHMRLQMESLTTHSSAQQSLLQQELQAFVTETARTMAELQRQMMEQSGSSVARVSEDLARLVASFQQRQEEALERLSTKLTTMHDELDRKLTATLAEVANTSQASGQALTTSVQGALADLQAQQATLLDQTRQGATAAVQQMVEKTTLVIETTERLSERMNTQAAEIHRAVAAMMTQTHSGTSELAAQQERYAQRLTDAMKAFDALVAGFDARVERHRGMVEAMAEGLGHFRGAAQTLSDASKQFSVTQERTDHLLVQITSQARAVDERLKDFERVNHQLRATVDHHGQMLGGLQQDTSAFFGEVRGQVEAFAGAVEDSMERYHGVASQSLDGFLGKMTDEMGKAVEALGGSVHNLEEVLDDLGDRLAEGGRR